MRVVVVHDITEREDEEQKEVREAKGNEEKESEVDGEVGERESLNVRMRHGDDDETNKAQTCATV